MAKDRKKHDETKHDTSSDEENEQQDLAGFDSAIVGIKKQMQQPSSFVIVVLVLVIFLLAIEFGSLQRQINEVQAENKAAKEREMSLRDQI